MAGLPTGTVTFLFTDIEGSTRLLQRLGNRPYTNVLEGYRRLLRKAFAERCGQEVNTQGGRGGCRVPSRQGCPCGGGGGAAGAHDPPVARGRVTSGTDGIAHGRACQRRW